jgi:hypothetical protein
MTTNASNAILPTARYNLGASAGGGINVVTDYGADPMGTSDSTNAINNAIGSGMSPVVLPCGTYKVTSLTISVNNLAFGGQLGGCVYLSTTSATANVLAVSESYNVVHDIQLSASMTLTAGSCVNLTGTGNHVLNDPNDYSVYRDLTTGFLFFSGNQTSFSGFKWIVNGSTTAGTLNNGGVLTSNSLAISSPTTWANNQSCTAGQIMIDASYVYVCTATNTVKRVPFSSF